MSSLKGAKMAEAPKAMSKTETLNTLSDASGVAKKDVAAVLEALAETAKKQLSKKGPGVFTIPNLLKLKIRIKKATPERKGINRFTGEEQVFKAKPASRQVKATILKKFKDSV
jgi:nucleoid DNA-binding protein